ncbi:hypothetical protein [Streptomyces sp. AC154]|uniref:hypothetical protein n=1 Tax=Streptomyces sp. AC154 TaxID=3143184 RepID=UPI003F7E4FC8
MTRIGRDAIRCLLARRHITFQRTRTWKESLDPERGAKPDRIEEVLERFPDRVFAFDEFEPLGIRPTGGSCWAEQRRPERHPAIYHRAHEVRQKFHGCYPVGDDTLWGVNHRKRGRRDHPGHAEVDLRRLPGRHLDLCDPQQPVRPQGRRSPPLGEEEQGRAVLHTDLRSWANPSRPTSDR